LIVESGEWRVESGEWRVESGKWKVESVARGIFTGIIHYQLSTFKLSFSERRSFLLKGCTG
jgi:hypothetical protein